MPALFLVQIQKSFRPALRACGRPTFHKRLKSRQKRFLQAAAVDGADGRGLGLGVRNGALIEDLLVRAECSSSAYGRDPDYGFDDYRSGVVSILPTLISWGC